MTSGKPHYENKPFDIPENWKWCKVEDVFDLNPKNNVADDTEAGFIPMELVSAGIGYSHSFVPKRWKEIKKGFSHFRNGDIGIAKISPCFENRKSTIFYNLPNNIGAGTTELTVLRGHCVNTEFYLYLFQSEWYICEGTKYFKGVVGQQRVHKDIFTSLLMPLPPIAEQNRIVVEIKKWLKIVDEIDNDYTDLKNNIKQARLKILDLAIQGRLLPQNPNDESATSLLTRIIPEFKPCDTSHYPNLPKNWTTVNLLDICKIDTGKWDANHATVNGKYRFYTCASQFAFSDTKRFSGDCLIIPGNGDIGAVYYYNGEFDAYQRTYVLHDIKIYPKYLYYHFLSNWRHINSDKQFGSTIKFVRIGNFQNYTVTLPPHEEQIRIVQRLDEILSFIDEISAEL